MLPTIPENDGSCTRRDWLKAAGALTLGAAFAPSVSAAAEPDGPAATPRRAPAGERGKKQAARMQIGILLGTFSRPTLEARLDAVRA